MSRIKTQVGWKGSPPCLWPLVRLSRKPVFLVTLLKDDMLRFLLKSLDILWLLPILVRTCGQGYAADHVSDVKCSLYYFLFFKLTIAWDLHGKKIMEQPYGMHEKAGASVCFSIFWCSLRSKLNETYLRLLKDNIVTLFWHDCPSI